MKESKPSLLEQLSREALALGADALEVEYRNGHEEVVAYMGALGREIARFPSNSAASVALRRDLYDRRRRPLRLSLNGREYVVRSEVYDNFGEDAYRVNLGRSNKEMQLTRSATARRRGSRS